MSLQGIFFAAFSLRLLSLCDFFACTSRPCNSSFDQLRLSDVIGSKLHICNFDSVSQELHQTSKPSRPQIFRSVTSGPFEAQVILRIILVFIDWYIMMAWTLSAKIHRVCVLPFCVSPFLCVTHSSVCVTSLCGETSRNSSVWKEQLSPLNFFRSHEYRLIICLHFYRFQILF